MTCYICFSFHKYEVPSSKITVSGGKDVMLRLRHTNDKLRFGIYTLGKYVVTSGSEKYRSVKIGSPPDLECKPSFHLQSKTWHKTCINVSPLEITTRVQTRL